ncbi:MAG: hypothetical protein NTX72_00485 [Candidatus Uhrbacteria bacterium]|nr:hypothetical protein [Candidatus Uhrbacteria bacterium]
MAKIQDGMKKKERNQALRTWIQFTQPEETFIKSLGKDEWGRLRLILERFDELYPEVPASGFYAKIFVSRTHIRGMVWVEQLLLAEKHDVVFATPEDAATCIRFCEEQLLTFDNPGKKDGLKGRLHDQFLERYERLMELIGTHLACEPNSTTTTMRLTSFVFTNTVKLLTEMQATISPCRCLRLVAYAQECNIEINTIFALAKAHGAERMDDWIELLQSGVLKQWSAAQLASEPDLVRCLSLAEIIDLIERAKKDRQKRTLPKYALDHTSNYLTATP